MSREPRIPDLVSRLGRVRASRVKPDWAPVMGGEVEKVRKELGKRVRGTMQLTEAWRELAPPELVDHAWPTGIARGTLKIAVEGPAFRYMLERWLKSGGQAALLSRCSASIKRVRVETVARDGG
jgi:hypothetical protein